MLTSSLLIFFKYVFYSFDQLITAIIYVSGTLRPRITVIVCNPLKQSCAIIIPNNYAMLCQKC